MSSTPLYSLIYTSQSVEPFSLEELDQLLEQSQRNNQALDLTGMLVHLGGSFMQILEGPKEAVTGLYYHKIAHDERHIQVEVATEGAIPQRQFSKWTMAFENLDGKIEARPEGFSDFVKKGFTTELASEHHSYSVSLLASFQRTFGPSLDSLLGHDLGL